jgi:threonine/homoserine/homoserine lactone efflux protein
VPDQSLFAVFLFAVAVSVGAVISPGPVSAAVVTESPRSGWRVGPMITSGHAFLELIMVILIAIGLSSGLGSPSIQRAIAIVGGIVLILLGGSYLLSSRWGGMRLPQADVAARTRSSGALFSLGVATTLSNPFWYAWWVTVAAGYLLQAQRLGLAAVGVFYLGHVGTDLGWNSLLSSLTSAGRSWLTPPRYQALVLLTGAAMAYFGVVFLRSAFTT